MADIALIRKRLRAEIEQSQRSAAERRARARTAERDYETFLNDLAIPLFRQLVTVLRAEGQPFELQTPAGGVRLASDRNRDLIELVLDIERDPPAVTLKTLRTRGSRTIEHERVINERLAIDRISEDELLERIFDALRDWLA